MTRQVLPELDRPVQYVKGVGPARAAHLARLDIHTVEDLLYTAPRRYEDRSQWVSIRALTPGQIATIRGKILAKGLRRLTGGRTIVEAAVGDETGIVSCRWFHQPYLERQLRVGEEVIVFGTAELAAGNARRSVAGRWQMTHPELERVEDELGDAALHMGRIVPIYPLTQGISQRWMRRTAHAVVHEYAQTLDERLPNELRLKLELPSVSWAVSQLHFPDAMAACETARRRLAFDELLLLQLRVARRRAAWTARRKPQRYQAEGLLAAAFYRQLPFRFTAEQTRVLQELSQDLCSPRPMLRLLQGDVGCGKTVVAAALMAVVIQSGYQVALMAPTELLADQHARVLRDYFEPLGVTVAVLSKQVGSVQRVALMKEIAAGEMRIIVGTHALLTRAVTFHNLAFVVIDEQHKFGVAQRRLLVGKAAMPDILVMTATPIPRTLALSFYGDLACSTITELPPGRQPVRTAWYLESERADVYRLIRDEVRQGRQAYVVYPLVEASERQDVKAATQMAATLQAGAFADLRVGLLHGQMRAREQERVMREFAQGQVQVLVSTVIVEVGLDVPNAAVMLIEHPERFGLAQLHQLRGRIGRGRHASQCLLIIERKDEAVSQRLAAFASTSDGFRLAELDLKLRGPGELLGRRQHGWLRLRVADVVRDRELMELARREAEALVARDPDLALPDHAGLKRALARATQATPVR